MRQRSSARRLRAGAIGSNQLLLIVLVGDRSVTMMQQDFTVKMMNEVWVYGALNCGCSCLLNYMLAKVELGYNMWGYSYVLCAYMVYVYIVKGYHSNLPQLSLLF